MLTDIFQDPVDYFPPEPSATYVEHTLLCGQTIKLRLVGHNPLWVPTILHIANPFPRRAFSVADLILRSRSHPSGTLPMECRPSHFKIPPATRTNYCPRQIRAGAWSWGRAPQSCCRPSWGEEGRCYRLPRCGPDSQPQSQHRQYYGPQ